MALATAPAPVSELQEQFSEEVSRWYALWVAIKRKPPGLASAIAMLEEGGANALVVVKLDRLTRSVRDLGELLDRYFASRFSLLSLADSIDTRTASGRPERDAKSARAARREIERPGVGHK